MSPTVFWSGKYRFYFFSREEERIHIHVWSPEGEAKFWLDPVIALAKFSGLTPKEIREIQLIIEGHRDEIVKAWKKHFRS
ncbi:MAG TPA: DUF4160 domain-containing protein [Bdellovibrionota bacterium]|nr:DUF4160 domain-containing protein [Bdellovibrionota bacterium]